MNKKDTGIFLTFNGLLFFLLILATPCRLMAYDEKDMLKERIERLEKELKELKTLINKNTADNQTMAVKKKAPAEAEKRANDFSVKPYGYVKLDASYDDSAVTNGNYVVLVPSEAAVKNDNEFNITARQTRLGLDVTAPEFNGVKIVAKAEIDFYGDGPTPHETKAEPFLRHAYLNINKGNLSFLAGQTWDVVSPLNPTTLNYPVGWAAGNIGYRRPQLRISYKNSFDKNTGLLMQFAISRTTGLTNEDLDGGGRNDGDDSGFPTIQGRIALTTKGFAGRKSVIGISGHYGQEEADWEGVETDFKSWSGNMDFDFPLSERFTLKGEVFMGENLDDYFGGILQGVNAVARKEILSVGMWSQLNFYASKKWQYNIGMGIDNPDYNDINDGMRDKNSFYYVNTLFNILPKLTIGLEYSHWVTVYKNLARGDDNRLQTSVVFVW